MYQGHAAAAAEARQSEPEKTDKAQTKPKEADKPKVDLRKT